MSYIHLVPLAQGIVNLKMWQMEATSPPASVLSHVAKAIQQRTKISAVLCAFLLWKQRAGGTDDKMKLRKDMFSKEYC